MPWWSVLKGEQSERMRETERVIGCRGIMHHLSLPVRGKTCNSNECEAMMSCKGLTLHIWE